MSGQSNAPINILPARRSIREVEKEELILEENSERWVLFPIEYPSLWEFYKKIETSFWTPEEFPWKDEKEKIKSACLPDWAQTALKTFALHFNLCYGIPASIAGAKDTIDAFLFPDILDLSCEFVEAIQTPEGRAYLGFQAMYENFHREVFTKYLQTLMDTDPATLKEHYLREQTRPTLVAKQKWLAHHMEGFHREDKVKLMPGDHPDFLTTIIHGSKDPAPMAEVLIALTVMKSIFTFGLALMHNMMKDNPSSAIYKSTERLWTDLTLHADFSAHLYSSLQHKLEPEIVRAMLAQAIELEYDYLADLTDNHLDAENVSRLLHGVGLRTLTMFGFPDEEVMLVPKLPCTDAGKLPPDTLLPVLQPFKVVHQGPFRIIPPEKRSNAEKQQMEREANTTEGAPVFQTDDDF